MVEIKNVTKKFYDQIGNFNISINIKKGEVYGIVGPNGSGKTTLIRQVLGFIKSDSGSIKVDGIDSWVNRKKIMQFTGYVAGENTIYENLKAKQLLDIAFYLKNNANRKYLNYLIKYFDLDTNYFINKMSTGMKQKVSIIMAFMHKPKFLILDEPTSGLDPIMQEQFRRLVNNLVTENNTTAIICSHIFEEIVSISNRVGFLKKGELIYEHEVKDKNIYLLKDKFTELYGNSLYDINKYKEWEDEDENDNE